MTEADAVRRNPGAAFGGGAIIGEHANFLDAAGIADLKRKGFASLEQIVTLPSNEQFVQLGRSALEIINAATAQLNAQVTGRRSDTATPAPSTVTRRGPPGRPKRDRIQSIHAVKRQLS